MAERYSHDYMWGGLNPVFRTRLETMIEATGGAVYLISGYRDNAHQQDLYNDAVARYGPNEAGRWAAPPGKSNHNRGLAADLGFGGNSDYWQQWVHDNAGRFGLYFPMDHEPWHIQPLGIKDGEFGVKDDPDAYTAYPGHINPAMRRADPMLALDMLLRGPQDGTLNKSTGVMNTQKLLSSETPGHDAPDLDSKAIPLKAEGGDLGATADVGDTPTIGTTPTIGDDDGG